MIYLQPRRGEILIAQQISKSIQAPEERYNKIKGFSLKNFIKLKI